MGFIKKIENLYWIPGWHIYVLKMTHWMWVERNISHFFKKCSKIIHFKHITMFSWSDTFFKTWNLKMSGKPQITTKKSILHKYNIWHSCNAKWYNVSIPDGKQKEWTQINLCFLNMQFNCFMILIEIKLVKFKCWL